MKIDLFQSFVFLFKVMKKMVLNQFLFCFSAHRPGSVRQHTHAQHIPGHSVGGGQRHWRKQFDHVIGPSSNQERKRRRLGERAQRREGPLFTGQKQKPVCAGSNRLGLASAAAELVNISEDRRPWSTEVYGVPLKSTARRQLRLTDAAAEAPLSRIAETARACLFQWEYVDVAERLCVWFSAVHSVTRTCGWCFVSKSRATPYRPPLCNMTSLSCAEIFLQLCPFLRQLVRYFLRFKNHTRTFCLKLTNWLYLTLLLQNCCSPTYNKKG